MTPASARRRLLLSGLILVAGLWIAPALPPGWIVPVSGIWYLALISGLRTGFPVLATWTGRPAAMLLLALGLGSPILLTSLPASTSLATHLPCPRNWGWLTTWLLRSSPMGSVTLTVGGPPVKICYGRPALRGRTLHRGGLVPFGRLWRTGANEPTTIISSIPLEIAGLPVGPGRTAVYTVPGPETWEIILNRSTSQWGIESEYTEAVQSQEIGRAIVRSESAQSQVERFTVAAGDNDIVLTWGATRVRIPITAASR